MYKFKQYQKTKLIKNHLNMGATNPQDGMIDVTNLYFVRDQQPWIGVMGEYHFSRDNCDNWYHELCKMKAGGISIVSTYLFWIYHEEREGQFNFTGNQDIRSFVLAAQEAGLDAFIRIGPWAHGECRNGGLPDWLLQKPYKLRDNNPDYLAKARIWYEKVYEQVEGLFYQDGGNIIGIQFENELVNNAAHLLELKKIALDIGYRAPLYTVTGWNSAYGAKIPVDEVVPVFGAYPEAPWAGHTNKRPLSPHYTFNRIRNDSAIGLDVIDAVDKDGWRLPYEKYPFATCELGGGMQNTHHRRPIINGMDIYALSLVKLGCGNNLPGYYMYHGGTHKLGELSTLQESKATGYPNDYSLLSYDFQGPLSEYGEVREQYRLLNLLHLFIHDFGSLLAPMEAVDAQVIPPSTDLSALRYSMRTDGKSGFVFINHYQRLAEMEDLHDVVIDTGSVVFPAIDVCGDVSFFMPFNLNMNGNQLEYATTQPLCKVEDTYFFAAIPGIKPEYRFSEGQVFHCEPGLESRITTSGVKIVTLTWKQACYARKLEGQLYVGIDCDLYHANDAITAVQPGYLSYWNWDDTAFEKRSVKRAFTQAKVEFARLEELPFRPKYEAELHIGGTRKLQYQRITVCGDQGFIEINEACDAAQIYANEELVADIYYYGKPWRVPAALLSGKECYLVLAEMRDDFYREF